MKKNLSILLIIGLSLILNACSSTTTNTPSPVVIQATQAPEATKPATQIPTPTQTSIPDTQTPETEPILVSDAFGKQVSLESPAQRVISLAPSNTEILYAIGAGDQVVGRDAFSDFPVEAQALTDIGGGFGALNIEAIVALDADLVLAADLTPPEQIQAFEDLGLTVFSLPNPNNFEELYDNLRVVAQLTGQEKTAEDIIQSLQDRVADVERAISQIESRPLVFYELDASDVNAPFTAGPGTFIDYLIQAAGGDNLGSSMEGAWVQVSVEELITRNPEIIILGDYTWGGITSEMVSSRSGWEVIDAVKNNQVYTFDDNLVSRPGPRLVEGLEVLAKLLHPDMFE